MKDKRREEKRFNKPLIIKPRFLIIIIIIIIIIIKIITIITLFKSLVILAKHKCSTNWGDCKSNKSNQIRGKSDYPEKNLSEQSREPTNSVHI